jgi:sulfite exporter TauE/SafE
MDIWVAFITGLTTGGLSCMAVQGGLLAGSLANQIEQDLVSGSKKKVQPRLALPILLFLLAKLTVYTLAGFLFGLLGSVFQLNNVSRAVLQFAIGIFLVGNALRMFNVHPIFRFFNFEPPARLTRYIRRKAKNSNSWVSPVFLGALTILIPCGVTQGVMAAAVATANPWQGAALMFAFTLGTSPVFFILSYFATRLSSMMEKYFLRIVAVILLVLGLMAVDSGLNLIGSPYSFTQIARNIFPPETQLTETVGTTSNSELQLAVKGSGYEPETLKAPANQPIKLTLVTNKTYSCARAFTIPELDITKILPATGSVIVEIPPQQPGKVLAFSCSMGMYSGKIVFEG